MILKVIIRNIRKSLFLNSIKVIGFALSFCSLLAIALFVEKELSFDQFHSKSESIYRLTLTHPDFLGGKHLARIPNPNYLEDFKKEIPGIENYVRLSPIRGGVVKRDKSIYEISQGFIVDSTFLEVFDVELLSGNASSILDQPSSMIVSQTFANKLFGKSNPIGKTITIPAGQHYKREMQFTINGLMKDFPYESHFHPDFIASRSQANQNVWAWTYLLLDDKTNATQLEGKIISFLAQRADVAEEDFKTKAYLQALGDIHLHSNKLREIEQNGNMSSVHILVAAAFIILIISISNYTNLNTGMRKFSAKYLYVSQILGSSKGIKIRYLLAENFVIITVSVFFSVILFYGVNQLIKTHYAIDLIADKYFHTFIVLLSIWLLAIVTAVLPMFIKSVSNFNGKSKFLASVSPEAPGRLLTIGQYSFTIVLIIAVIVVYRQTSYALENGIGSKQSNVLVIEGVHVDVQKKFELLKNELSKHKSIQSVSAMMEPPGGEANDMFPFEMEGYTKTETEDERIGVFPCDYSFPSMFNLKFLYGHDFSKNNIDSDGFGEYIINEAAMKQLQYSKPDDIVGKAFKLSFVDSTISLPQGKIIGVVKDFHLSSIKKNIEPLVFFKRQNMWLLNFAIAYEPGMRSEATKHLQSIWSEIHPGYPLNYQNVDVLYQKVYKSELLQARLLSVFTGIALFMCIIGLLGLVLIITHRRTKEIGIRKVNGAKVGEILAMLNKDFIKWVAIAFVIACPIAWYAMNVWLGNFAYKTSLSWWIFALAGLTAMFVALLTVSWQSWKAARRNPVEALRYE
jgi:putative ABC transport system permease protein